MTSELVDQDAAEQWIRCVVIFTEAIGYYDKTEISTSSSSGSSRQSPFQLFTGANTTYTTNLNQKREYIVKPEEITRMQSNKVYIIDGLSAKIAHTTFI